jgi:peptidoglycan hydrolase CwlO-like protein
MKKRILALVLICIIMISTTTSFANKDDVPKIYSVNRIPPISVLKY